MTELSASQPPKRIGFVTLGANVPSTRFRFFPYQGPLNLRGHRCRIWTSYPSVYDYFKTIGWRLSYQLKKSVRNLQWLDARRFRPDVIYLERGCFHDESIFMDERFRRTTPRLVLDVDDGVFLQFPKKMQRLIELSDHVIVSNKSIEEYVKQFRQEVTEIPTCVPLERFTLKPTSAADHSKPTVGWMGTTSNMGFLGVCAGALRRVARDTKFQLLVVGPTDEPLKTIDLAGVNVRFVKWNADQEIGWLHKMDIGIMPLPSDQEWMKYKAATKLVQYMSVGIPAVASPIGVNAEILRDNKIGFAATSESEWADALLLLLRDADLRSRLGRAGRALAEASYSIEANVPILERVLTASTADSLAAVR